MSPASSSAAASLKGKAAAWFSGIAASSGTAILTFYPSSYPVGGKVLQALQIAPESRLPLLSAYWLAAAAGLAAVAISVSVGPLRRVAALLAAVGLLTLSQSAVLGLYGWSWDPLPALLAIVAGGGVARLLRPAVSGLTCLFQGRLSSPALATLAKARDLSFLRPDQRDATVLTCRLLNENALREILSARDFLKLCDTFRARASAILLHHGACLDPAEPNGVRAFFGLPLTTAAPADEAVKAALALDDAMQNFFAAMTPAPPEIPVCGLGLATGTLTAGVTGSAYTVLGDAVELSRWLAIQNSSYQTRVLLDAATHLAADTVEDRPLEFINPPDGAAVEIFQLLGVTGSLSREGLTRRNAFRDAIMLLRAGHTEDAAKRFDDARTGPTGDPVLEYFVSLANDQAQRDAASHGQIPLPSPRSGAPLPPHGNMMPTPPDPAPAAPSPTPRRKGQPGRKLPRRL